MTHRSLARTAAFAAAVCLACAGFSLESQAVAAPGEVAQAKPKTPKKGAKPPEEEKAAEPASTDSSATAPKTEEPASSETKTEETTKTKVTEAPAEEWDDTDVTEKPGKTYYFVGARYRGTIIPKFLLNMFVDEGATIYSNTIGLEVDIRKDNFSLIPSLTYVEYGTGDILFKEKGKPDTSNNWSVVNSGLKGIYANVDLLWSTKVHKNWDFEYGLGVGIGVLFGNLQNNWVYADPNGPLKRDDGVSYSRCQSITDQDKPTPTNGTPTCDPRAHSNSTENKVGNYTEKFWSGGGSIPNVFIHLAIPSLGIRYKPRKDIEARLGLGFSLTGFWFGLSGNYGLETALEKGKTEPTTSKSGPMLLMGQNALNMPMGF